MQETGFLDTGVKKREYMGGAGLLLYICNAYRAALRHIVRDVFFVEFDHAFFRLIFEAK